MQEYEIEAAVVDRGLSAANQLTTYRTAYEMTVQVSYCRVLSHSLHTVVYPGEVYMRTDCVICTHYQVIHV